MKAGRIEKIKKLTPRQGEVLEFLKDFVSENGYPPSLREICTALGINGPANAGKHLDALERKGFIRRTPGASRGIEVAGVPGVRDAVSVPIAGRVRAGEPHLAVEDVLGRVVLDGRFFKATDAFLLQVEGDSMTGAGIDAGDFVMVRPGEAREGDIVVALVGDEATVKRFSKTGSTVVLRPENPAYEPLEVGEGDSLQVVGKVISVIKRLD